MTTDERNGMPDEVFIDKDYPKTKENRFSLKNKEHRDKYHHDSIVQAKDAEIERLSALIEQRFQDGKRLCALEMDAENERLRKALKSIADNTCCGPCREAGLVAREALKKEGD
jgi:Flp pilus assembly CpaF family ATPase